MGGPILPFSSCEHGREHQQDISHLDEAEDVAPREVGAAPCGMCLLGLQPSETTKCQRRPNNHVEQVGLNPHNPFLVNGRSSNKSCGSLMCKDHPAMAIMISLPSVRRDK
jgi:hypothetical protein